MTTTLADLKDCHQHHQPAPARSVLGAKRCGLGLRQREDGDVVLLGTGPPRAVDRLHNRVPEPVTVKQRVHLDVAGPRREVLARAARPWA